MTANFVQPRRTARYARPGWRFAPAILLALAMGFAGLNALAVEPISLRIIETPDGELISSSDEGFDAAVVVDDSACELTAEESVAADCQDDDCCDWPADEDFEGYPVLGAEAPCPPVCRDVRLCIDRCQRAEGEFWIVSTREAPMRCNLDQGLGCITYWKRTGRDRYQQYSLEAFLAAMDPSLPTCIYVHGNTLDWDGAIEGGTRVYRKIGRGIHGFRLVLWSWPAERIKGAGLESNVVIKADRAESQGYYLAWLVDLIDPRVPLSLAGHSYGCRTITAGLQGLAVGHAAGYRLPPRQYIGWRPMEACLVAAAMDKWLLTPRGRHALAVTQVDRMLITVNPNDRTLALLPKWFNWEALGLNGLPARPIVPYDQRVIQLESTSWVNKAHRFQAYAHDRELADRLRPYFFYLDAPEPIPAELVPAGDELEGAEPMLLPDDLPAADSPEVDPPPASDG
ncbi:MAG: hypothetical protein AB7U73_10685 [Pirellulales bacterium]